MNEFRKNKPTAIGEIDFSLPNVRYITLDNGINLIFIRKDNLPVVQMELLLNAGSCYEPADKEGLAFLTAMLLDEGAAEYNALELNNEIEKIGSSLTISSDKDYIYISMLSLSEYIERSIELFSKIVVEPNLSVQDFGREKNKLLTRIIQTKDNPAALASNIFDTIIYKNSPYSSPVSGSEKSVSGLEVGDVKDFYFSHSSNSSLTLVVVGSEPEEKIISLLQKHLVLSRKGDLMKNIIINPNTDDKKRVYLIDSEDAGQSEIRIGHIGGKRNSPDYFAKHIMNSILGGQFTSRINLNLREDKGYTYGAGSYFDYNKFAGSFVVTTSVQTEVTSNAIKEILKELAGIQSGVSSDELQFAKAYIIKKFPSLFETYSQISNNIVMSVLHNLEKNYFDTYLDNVRKVSIENVNNAALKYIHPENSVILVHGNKNLIEPQLKKLFNSDIIEIDKDGLVVG